MSGLNPECVPKRKFANASHATKQSLCVATG
jgi:hypothetical protein